MTTRRISAVAIALGIAFGFVGGAGSTQGSSERPDPVRRDRFFQTDGGLKEWTTANLNSTRR